MHLTKIIREHHNYSSLSIQQLYKMAERKFTLRYNLGSPEEMIILTSVDEQRYQQILALVRAEKLTATQAYDRTRPEKD